ncbi:MAG: DUF1592 domain-containing protein [Bryobacter sp.]|nr:DUF1592 domain-containing protein [Bryobacter sp.]
MSFPRTLAWCFSGLLGFAAEAPPPLPPAPVSSFLAQNCVPCHQGAKAPLGLDFKQLTFDLSHPETLSRWTRIHDAVEKGSMPPRPLAADARQVFLRNLAAPVANFTATRARTQGRSILRRLNRYEYENTLRDLLGAPWLQLKDSLPEDGIAHRFNKSGEALDISHVQMARYLDTAEQALRDVFAAQQHPPSIRRYYARDQRRFHNRMRYSPFNTAPERAMIPIYGFEAQRDVLSDSVPISIAPYNAALRELEGFATPAGTFNGNDYSWDEFRAPVGGRYKIRLNAFSLWLGTVEGPFNNPNRKPWWRPSRQHTEKGRTNEPLSLYALQPGGEKRYLTTIDLSPEPTVHEVEVDLVAGDSITPDAARLVRTRPGWLGSPHASKEGMPGVAYRWMEVEGPAPPPSPLLLPKRKEQLRPTLAAFLARALRRPYTPAELDHSLSIAAQKSDLREATIAAYTSVLCSPAFLYLEEKPGPLDAYALAARLSYFLSNSAPDATLRALAANGQILQPATLRTQAARLLAQPQSQQFFNAFLDYWLDLRKLNDNTPDVILYPDYYIDDLLTESAEKQTRAYFAHLVTHNRPARELVQSNYTFLNFHLANHYKLPAVPGSALRQVELPPGNPRGGLLAQASILKLTANGTTTSPVLRGAWIMERILGQPAPPPPPGVGSVEPDTRGATTIREQLDKHRNNPGCASCHRHIDPPGFALESFDVLGGERTHYRSTEEGSPVWGIGKNGHEFTFKQGKPVDASGEFQGQPFANLAEFQSLLARQDRVLARNLVRQFLTYATGAPPAFHERAEVERILDAAQPSGYGVRTLLLEVVQSKLFLEK